MPDNGNTCCEALVNSRFLFGKWLNGKLNKILLYDLQIMYLFNSLHDEKLALVLLPYSMHAQCVCSFTI